MTKLILAAVLAAGIVNTAQAQAPAAPTTTATPAPAPAANAPLSTTNTDLGTLLDNPTTKAIIDKHIPGMSTNPQIDMARGMTLRVIQPYAADMVTDAALAAIDADLAKLNTGK